MDPWGRHKKWGKTMEKIEGNWETCEKHDGKHDEISEKPPFLGKLVDFLVGCFGFRITSLENIWYQSLMKSYFERFCDKTEKLPSKPWHIDIKPTKTEAQYIYHELHIDISHINYRWRKRSLKHIFAIIAILKSKKISTSMVQTISIRYTYDNYRYG